MTLDFMTSSYLYDLKTLHFTTEMGIIKLQNIRTFSYHGCLEEEAKIGSDYRVDLEIKADLRKGMVTDELADTVDYVQLNRIVVEEMAIRSKLLEHVAQRIVKRIFAELPEVSRILVAVSKINPPIGGDVEAVTIQVEEFRA
jgi:7,8-dihydroneopterin aldolase/epimerase/oxygenase